MISNKKPSKFIDSSFLLYAHMVCADGQIHIEESRALDKLAVGMGIGSSTKEEMDKIISQADDMKTLNEVILNIPEKERVPCMMTLASVAYADGFCDPLERKMLEDIAVNWKISIKDINAFCALGENAALYSTKKDNLLDYQQDYSLGEKILTQADYILSGKLIKALIVVSSGSFKKKIESVKKKIILSGPEYDEAIERCRKIAEEDLKFTVPALNETSDELKTLKKSLKKNIEETEVKAANSEAKTAQEVLKFLKETESHLENEISRKLEKVRHALYKKERAIQYFTISFIGKTKSGKSTLHAVITGEGEDAIGCGKQRTTRLNRVYEWKNIRIIDTPGIGAPGGKTDEAIAESIIDESDVICFILTNNNQQETEFAFLRKLKEKAKPLIILLNVMGNLNHQRKLELFLENSDKLFSIEDKNALGGHYDHIKRYALQHYGNAYFDIIPVQLYAALLSGKEEDVVLKDKLFKASRLQDFLDSLKLSLIQDGTIRRSQTLLGCTVGDILLPLDWCIKKYQEIEINYTKISKHQKKAHEKISKFSVEAQKQLQLKIKKVFADIKSSIQDFAEDNWNSKEDALNRQWQNHLKNMRFELRLKTAFEEVMTAYTNDIQELLEEIGKEMSLTTKMMGSDFKLDEQDSSVVMQNFFKFGGGLLGLAGSGVFAAISLGALTNAWNPVGWGLAAVAIVFGLFSMLFTSKAKKMQNAVNNITASIKEQLDRQERVVLKSILNSCEKSTDLIAAEIQTYFETLANGLKKLGQSLKSTNNKLEKTAHILNCAYGKRVVDWLQDSTSALSEYSIDETIVSVDRILGKEINIQTKNKIEHNKSSELITSVLQETLNLNKKGEKK
jgi:uncharacterized tellurite resistance protein B-like protein/GTP-binding protein EngB required for normal cell division/uncharacterized membrane-anchored protein YhcB (DUF1043 family)